MIPHDNKFFYINNFKNRNKSLKIAGLKMAKN